MKTPEEIQAFLESHGDDEVAQYMIKQYGELFEAFAPMLQEIDRHQWQPIDTVPDTDVNNVLDFWVPGYGRVPNAYFDHGCPAYKKWTGNHTVTVVLRATPTHWMRRPKAPKGQQEENPKWL
jgi:hypothetical protein